MDSRYWKNSLKQINSGLDRCDATLDALNNFDDVVHKKIYKSPDTLVEVNIKTKKSSKSPVKQHHLGVTSTKYPRQLAHPSPKKPSQRHSNLKKKVLRKPGSSDDKTNSCKQQNLYTSHNIESNPDKQVTFQHRTLKLILAEIKATLSQGLVDQALQHLEDVEYIALNLDSDGARLLKASPCKKIHAADTDEVDESHKNKVSLLIQEKKELERELVETKLNLEHALKLKSELHGALDAKEKKLDELKLLISRLSSTNEDMVLHLKEKIKLEDNLKVIEASNQHLTIKYEETRTQNIEALKTLKGKELEIKALHKVIEDMKKALSHDFNFLERPIKHISFEEEAPSLTSDLSKISTLTNSSTSRKTSFNRNNTSTESDEGVFSETVTFPKIIRAPPTKDTLPPPESDPSTLSQKSSADVRYGENASFVKNSLNAKVKDFLERMKKSSNLDISIPDLPQRKSFDEMSLPLNLTEDMDQSSTTQERNLSKLTDSSLYLSSNESTGS